MTRYFRTAGGQYEGAWDGAEPPAGLIEVPQPPVDARATWNGSSWDEPTPPAPRYSKAAIIETLSVEEAAIFEAGLNSATAQSRLIWLNAPDVLNGANPAWLAFEALLSGAFGATRAAEILNTARLS